MTTTTTIVANTTRSQVPSNRQPQFTYLRFQLLTERLDDRCRDRLERHGVECVQQGGAHEAFGIIDAAESYAFAGRDPQIRAVEVGAPPSGF